MGMQRFIMTNNSNSGVPFYMTDPLYAPDYYQTLQGLWRDGSPMTYGGNGHPSTGGYGPVCHFMFPGMTDICDWGTMGQPPNGSKNWTEKTAANNPFDRRGVISSGPFTFKPGDIQELNVAFAWARNYTPGDTTRSIPKLGVVVDSLRSAFNANRVPGGDPIYGIDQGPERSQKVLKIYPNPAIDQLVVEPGSICPDSKLVIYDIHGLEVLKQAVAGKQTRISISRLPSGVYYVRVVNDQDVEIGKLIKQ